METLIGMAIVSCVIMVYATLVNNPPARSNSRPTPPTQPKAPDDKPPQ